jgi:two-component system probable response regulator PhcQ
MLDRVLLVDDEPNVVDALRRALRSEPYLILTATSARQALRMMEAQPVDVVVSDHDMPEMNGTDFLCEVRRRWSETIRFVLTGKASLEMAVRAINSGEVYRFLTKPCHHTDLAISLRDAIQNKRLMAEARRLLSTLKRQNDLLDILEKQNPGIATIQRDEDGSIVLDETPRSFDELLHEINRQVESANNRAGRTLPSPPTASQ